jgi:hypothetical protein
VMRVRLLIVLLLVSVILILTPLAYVDVPDQTWWGGLYDADEDDAIFHVQTHLSAIEPPALHVGIPSVPCIHAPPEPYECMVPGPVLSARHTRAPPAL